LIDLHVNAVTHTHARARTHTHTPVPRQGTNITVDCLHLALKRVLDSEGAVPPVLFLQLDNTSKQCKSRHMLGFLALLVHLGVCEDVWLSFLPVGHTHEDIDQFFSRISVYLQQHDARSRIGIAECVTRGYNKIAKKKQKDKGGEVEDEDQGLGRAHVIHRDRAANMSDHLDAHVSNLSADKEADNFSARRQFHLFRRPVSFSSEEADALGDDVVRRFKQEVGFEVHLEARTDAKGDWTKAWMTGMKACAASTRVFKYHEATTMDFLLDRAALFADVPPAQPSQPAKYDDDVDGQERKKDLAKVTRDTRRLMEARLGFTEEDKADLEECLSIINSTDDLDFDWDLAAYKLDEAAQAGQEGVDLAVRNFRAFVEQKKLVVGGFAAFRAPEDNVECMWLGKVKALHEDTSEIEVEWYHRGSVKSGTKNTKCATPPSSEQELAEEAKHRVYYLKKPPAFDRVHSETLQTVVKFKAASKTFCELDTESARSVQFYIDMMVKDREKDKKDEAMDEDSSDE